jgi:hypothetical protein
MQPTPFPCPRCGHVHQLDAAYLAAYGGRQTVCVACQRPLTLPVSAGGAHGYQQPVGYQQQQQVQFPGGTPAQGYGQPQGHGAGPAGQAQVLGYSGGGGGPFLPGAPVWREGKKILVASGSHLPDQCVKCGQPGNGKPVRKSFSWHEQWVSFLVLLSPIVYLIVAMVMRKQGKLTYSLCQRHVASRRNAMLVSGGVALLAIPMFFIGGSERDLVGLIPLGIVVLIGGLIALLITARTLTPTKIENNYLWLKGAGEGFLSRLPPSR